MMDGFHYTQCGLDYIWLLNGYTVEETRWGRAVSVQDADGLHQAIGRAIVGGGQRLRGQEVRFLRARLKLSQDGLAVLLGSTRGSVARWEAEPDKAIPGTADHGLRMLYVLKMQEHPLICQITDLLAELDERTHGSAGPVPFRQNDGAWLRQAA
ncbi:helix-turn-helix domain-containing protein [Novispirillum itersonii]|uniref:helix-turn-helix domain-containing protein n=1 Tax=Novispirillum itersonii TaxID=189 RepID=UPI001B7FE49A|nr:hypothetical protein [Novispirillum itersonii]